MLNINMDHRSQDALTDAPAVGSEGERRDEAFKTREQNAVG